MTETLIATIPKNVGEEVRVQLSEYKGAPMVSARTYWRDIDGDYKPGRNGINLKVDLLPQLREALEQAEVTAQEQGLLG